MVIAAATFWLPGPNFVIVLLGLLLIAGQLGFVARLIDRGMDQRRIQHRAAFEDHPCRIELAVQLGPLGEHHQPHDVGRIRICHRAQWLHVLGCHVRQLTES